MNVRDNKVQKTTQDQQEPSTTPAPAQPSENQIVDDNVSPDTARRVVTRNRLRHTWVPIMNLVVGFLTVIVIAFQAVIYNEQRKIMNTQSQFMQTQTQIMQNSFGLSEKSLRMSGRAFVSVATLDAALANGQVSLGLGNNGNVPATAINLEVNVYRAKPSADHSELKDIVSSKIVWDAGAVPLFPGNFRMSVVIPLQNFNEEDMKAVLAKNEILYVGGKIRYEDRNGNTDSTPFAYEYNPPPSDTWVANSALSKFFDK